jgi:SAM-dependent methyltransferase
MSEGLSIDFRVAPAERTPFPSASFDVLTAGQSWLYFDKARAIEETGRLLVPGGALLTCHLCWLPRADPIARATEELVLAHNPRWSGADWSGNVPARPGWAAGHFRVRAFFFYDVPLPFTREAWRGRIRACRGVGATLSPEEVRRFDAEHAELLEAIAPERFTVLHRIDAHVFEPE